MWLHEVSSKDSRLVGGKAAHLGELISAGVRVPPGFVVTTEAYKEFLRHSGIWSTIMDIVNNVDVNNLEALEEASRSIRKIIESAPMPRHIEDAIRSYYEALAAKVGVDEPLVAVRSSAVTEDLPDASFAGQQETYLNIRGVEDVIRAVKKCWGSVFTARAIFYRHEKKIPHERALMAVIVQKMVNSRSAGVMFTINPVTGDDSVIVIESSWGLGEAVVGGKVTPDRFVVRKSDLTIVERQISEKELAIVYDPASGTNKVVKLPPEKAKAPSLRDEEVVKLAEYGLAIEKHYGRAMDIEWAIDADLPFPDNIFIVQARPETVFSTGKAKAAAREEKEEGAAGRILVKGLPASPGVATGVARVILDPHSEEAKKFREGDVLVTRMTDPDWVPLMKKAAAIVTDEGGMTSHAAIVSRELGIPAVVGTRNATKVIRTGQLVTVDGSRGVVYEGKVEIGARKAETQAAAAAAPAFAAEQYALEIPVTATKIYMNLGEPNAIDKYLHLPFDGIGLMRIEFILSDWIGYHPLYLIETGREKLFVDKLAEGIAKVASAIYPRPVVVRFSDFKTNEYRGLKGGEKYEPEERNPMLGWRGVSRYIHPNYEKGFRLEVRAIIKVREEMGLKNVWVMLPFVRTTWEVERVLEIMKEEGLRRSRDFKVWIMAEVPSVVFLIDEFAKLVDGFSIGSNDLTQLVLGVDRDSQLLAEMGYFDERDPAVLKAIKMIIEGAHRNGKTVSICGQAPSVYPEIVEFLVEAGIDSISVNPDAVISTRRLVASVEKKIMLRKLLGKA